MVEFIHKWILFAVNNTQNLLANKRFKSIILFNMLLIVFISSFNGNQYIPDIGLDPSWQNAYNYFALYSFSFGRDVVFTFGPLGWLYSNTFHPDLYWYKIAFQMFLSIYTCLVFYLSIYEKNFYISILSLAGIILFRFLDPLVFILLLNSFILLNSIRNKYCNKIFIIIVCLFFSIVSLIKFTFFVTGFIVVFLIIIIYLLKRQYFSALTLGLAYPVFILVMWKITGQHIPDIIEYIVNSLYIASGYNEAMSIIGPLQEVYFGLVILFFVMLSIPFHELSHRILSINESSILILLTSIVIFISWKAGFVRHDGHVIIFYIFMIYLPATLVFINNNLQSNYTERKLESVSSFNISILLYNEERDNKKICLLAVILMYICAISFMNFAANGIKLSDALISTKSHIRSQVRLFSSHALSNQFNILLAELEKAERVNLIPLTSNIIGNETVDIYNYYQNIVLFNNMNWLPRPVFQSYSAYNTHLLEINRDSLVEKTPKYVLFKNQTIDGRYPLLDDTLWVRELIYNYSPQLIENGLLLLKKEKNGFCNDKSLSVYSKIVINFGETIYTEFSDEFLYASIKLDYNTLGKLRSFIFKPPEVYLDIETHDTISRLYRIIPNMVKQPFLISPIIETNDDLILTMADSFYNNVNSFSVLIDPKDAIYFEPRIEILLYISPQVCENVRNSYKEMIKEYYIDLHIE